MDIHLTTEEYDQIIEKVRKEIKELKKAGKKGIPKNETPHDYLISLYKKHISPWDYIERRKYTRSDAEEKKSAELNEVLNELELVFYEIADRYPDADIAGMLILLNYMNGF